MRGPLYRPPKVLGGALAANRHCLGAKEAPPVDDKYLIVMLVLAILFAATHLPWLGHNYGLRDAAACGTPTASRRVGPDSQASRSSQVSRRRVMSASPPVTTTSAGRGWPL
jgi:hypothetical protein